MPGYNIRSPSNLSATLNSDKGFFYELTEGYAGWVAGWVGV